MDIIPGVYDWAGAISPGTIAGAKGKESSSRTYVIDRCADTSKGNKRDGRNYNIKTFTSAMYKPQWRFDDCEASALRL